MCVIYRWRKGDQVYGSLYRRHTFCHCNVNLVIIMGGVRANKPCPLKMLWMCHKNIRMINLLEVIAGFTGNVMCVDVPQVSLPTAAIIEAWPKLARPRLLPLHSWNPAQCLETQKLPPRIIISFRSRCHTHESDMV